MAIKTSCSINFYVWVLLSHFVSFISVIFYDQNLACLLLRIMLRAMHRSCSILANLILSFNFYCSSQADYHHALNCSFMGLFMAWISPPYWPEFLYGRDFSTHKLHNSCHPPGVKKRLILVNEKHYGFQEWILSTHLKNTMDANDIRLTAQI